MVEAEEEGLADGVEVVEVEEEEGLEVETADFS